MEWMVPTCLFMTRHQTKLVVVEVEIDQTRGLHTTSRGGNRGPWYRWRVDGDYVLACSRCFETKGNWKSMCPRVRWMPRGIKFAAVISPNVSSSDFGCLYRVFGYGWPFDCSKSLYGMWVRGPGILRQSILESWKKTLHQIPRLQWSTCLTIRARSILLNERVETIRVVLKLLPHLNVERFTIVSCLDDVCVYLFPVSRLFPLESNRARC